MYRILTPEESWWSDWRRSWELVGLLYLLDEVVYDTHYWAGYDHLVGILKEKVGVRDDVVYARRPNGELMYHSPASYRRYLEMGDEAWQREQDELLRPKYVVSVKP